MKIDPKGGSCKTVAVLALMLYTFSMGCVPIAHAAMIGTGRYIETHDGSALRSQLHSVLEAEEVRQQLVAAGVEPELAEARVAALTEEELRQIAERMQELPTGGSFFGVVGIVFLVLILLEIVGVTDIFKKL